MATIQWRPYRRKDGTVTRTAILNWQEPTADGRKKQCRKSLGAVSPGEAEDYRLAKELELRTGAQVFSYAPLFGEFAEDYLIWRASEYPDSQTRVAQLVNDHLLPAFRYVALDAIKPRQVEKYKADRLNEVSEATVAKEVRSLKAMLNKAVEWELIHYSPIKVVSPPRIRTSRPIHWYSMEELQALYTVAGEREPIWQFMANTGLRRSEAAYLKLEHDRGDSVLIESTSEARTKSRKWREVPLSANGREALDRLTAAAQARESAYVLPIATPNAWTQSFKRDRKAAELGGSLHSLRHSFGTHHGLKGTPIRVLQQLMGHASIKTTEKYMHAAESHLKSAMDGFSI